MPNGPGMATPRPTSRFSASGACAVSALRAFLIRSRITTTPCAGPPGGSLASICDQNVADEIDDDRARHMPVDLQADGKGAFRYQLIGRGRLAPALAHACLRTHQPVPRQLLDDVGNRLRGQSGRAGKVGAR